MHFRLQLYKSLSSELWPGSGLERSLLCWLAGAWESSSCGRLWMECAGILFMFTGHSCEDAGLGFSSGADNRVVAGTHTSLKSLPAHTRNQTSTENDDGDGTCIELHHMNCLVYLKPALVIDVFTKSQSVHPRICVSNGFRCCQIQYNESGTKPTVRRHNIAVNCHSGN